MTVQTKVVILNWNGEAHLRRFLPSVVASTPPEVAIVVADNGSTDGSVELLQREFPTVEVILFDRNHGFTAGYNLALERVEADYYLIMNSDVEVTPGWTAPLIAALDAHADVAAVSPKILSCNDKRYFEYAGASGGFIDWLGYPFCRGRVLAEVEQDRGQHDGEREIFWTSGACMLIRSNVFWELGGFDVKFFAHMEEIDLCWRMHLAGYKTMVQPQSVVYHLGGGTLPNNNPQKLYLNYRNNLAMIYKCSMRPSRHLTLFLRMFMDAGAAMVYFATGNFAFARKVFLAHADYTRWKPELRRQRAALKERYCSDDELCRAADSIIAPNIYRGSIVARYFLGCRRFGKLL
ncbi:glycosyl transferase [Bacteroidia bacterium]|nr:glycosyl transferase [Bacteroidia bacterium]